MELEALEQRETPAVDGVYALPAVFALGDPVDTPIPPAVRNNPNVDSIALRARWNALQPSEFTYDWRFLDNQIQYAANAGKTVSLNILVGCHTPAWVYAAGAVKFRFNDPDRPCDPARNQQTMPIPWDGVFKTKWMQFIAALGQRYGDNPTVTHVKITGVNKSSGETALPSTPADTVKWVGATLREPLRYKPSRMRDAWGTFATAFAQAFPTKSVAAMLRPGAFPLRGEDYRPVSRGVMEQNIDQLIADGRRLVGSERFIAQNNGLKACWIHQDVADVAGQIVTGYQMNKAVTFDDGVQMATCKIPPNPPLVGAAAVLQAAVEKGIDHGARFLEIYQRDVTNPALADVIAYAHAWLTGGSGPGSGASPSRPQPALDLGGLNNTPVGNFLGEGGKKAVTAELPARLPASDPRPPDWVRDVFGVRQNPESRTPDLKVSSDVHTSRSEVLDEFFLALATV